MADFNQELPRWEESGIKPPSNKLEEGWKINDKPPADWENWLKNRTFKALQELQDKAVHKDAIPDNIETKEGAQEKAEQSLEDSKEYVDSKIENIDSGVSDVNGKKGSVTLNKADIGLSNVDNAKQATKEDFDDHIDDQSIHFKKSELSKSDVGLENIQNFGMASRLQAEMGVTDSKYMTPLRTKQAIEKLSPEGISEHDVEDKISTHSEDLEAHGLRKRYLALGQDAESSREDSISLGKGAKSSGSSSIALGVNVVATEERSIALGRSARSEGIDSIVVGSNARTLENSSVVLGNDAKADGFKCLSLGYNALAGDANSIALGSEADASGNASVAIGSSAEALDRFSIALGYSAESSVPRSMALGRASSAQGFNSLALGQSAEALEESSVAIGYLSKSDNKFQGVLGGSIQGQTTDWIVPGDFTVEGSKNFEIDHPNPEKKHSHRLRHGAVESPTAGDTLYRFSITANKDEEVVEIELPDYFVYLNKDVQIWVTGQDHFGNGYGKYKKSEEIIDIHCEKAGEYNILVVGTRNDDNVKEWDIMGVEREQGISWKGESYNFEVEEIIEVDEIKEGGES